jgi:hypothetical protein
VSDRPANGFGIVFFTYLILFHIRARWDHAIRANHHAQVGLHANKIIAAQFVEKMWNVQAVYVRPYNPKPNEIANQYHCINKFKQSQLFFDG